MGIAVILWPFNLNIAYFHAYAPLNMSSFYLIFLTLSGLQYLRNKVFTIYSDSTFLFNFVLQLFGLCSSSVLKNFLNNYAS